MDERDGRDRPDGPDGPPRAAAPVGDPAISPRSEELFLGLVDFRSVQEQAAEAWRQCLIEHDPRNADVDVEEATRQFFRENDFVVDRLVDGPFSSGLQQRSLSGGT